MLFFTADTHFLGKEILLRENRPFIDEHEFMEYEVKLWNEQATCDDDIWHIGDFANYNKDEIETALEALSVVKLINARVSLIIGNNEERIIQNLFDNDFNRFKDFCLELGFKNVLKDHFITCCGREIYLNHYPLNHKNGMLNLFGHTHRTTGLWKPYGLNMGCDLNHFYLFDENQLTRLIKDKELYWDTDVNNLCI
jgi:calcineurin-like phosphoesterase family protein